MARGRVVIPYPTLDPLSVFPWDNSRWLLRWIVEEVTGQLRVRNVPRVPTSEIRKKESPVCVLSEGSRVPPVAVPVGAIEAWWLMIEGVLQLVLTR